MVLMTMIFSIVSFLVGLPAIAISLYTLIELKAMKKSTHKIQYVPVPDYTPKQDQEFKESFNEDFSSQFIV